MLAAEPDFWSSIVLPRLKRLDNIAEQLTVAVIVCRRGTTPPTSNFKGHNIETRFYSDTETEDFLLALRSVGMCVVPFYREDDFIQWVLNGLERENLNHLFAYSSGASVSGVGVKALIPAFCALHEIQIMGPDPHVASLARHKYHAMALLRSSGIPVPPTQIFIPGVGWLDGMRPQQGKMIIVKPSHEAASIGVDSTSVVECDDGIDDFVSDRAASFRQSMTVQEFIPGYEVEVPAFRFAHNWFTPFAIGLSLNGTRNLHNLFLDYDTVASDRYGFYEFAAYHGSADQSLFSYTKRTASILGMRDLGRVDFRIDQFGSSWVIDVSTSPYISRHSSFAHSSSLCHGDPSKLPLVLLAAACDRLGLLS